MKKMILLSVLVLAGVAACDRRTDAAGDMGNTGESDVSAATDTDAGSTAGDGQIAQGAGEAGMADSAPLTLLMAVNAHEIAAAEQARGKNVDGATLEYANMMRDEHSKNQADTRALMGSQAEIVTPDVAALRQKGEAELSTLAALSGDAYEKGYIDAMVKGHADVLAMLDTTLIPAATNDGVKQHLAMTREHVAKHLEKARELQSSATR